MPSLSKKELYDLSQDLKTDESRRITEYETLERVMFDGTFEGVVDKALSKERKRPDGVMLLYNLLKARVADKTNLLKAVPDIKMEIPPGMGQDGPFWAEFMKRIVLSYWNFSHIHSMFELIGHYYSLYDCFFILTVPDMDSKRPRILIKHPKSTFVLPKFSKADEYIAVFFINKLQGRRILSAYPEASQNEIKNTKDEYEFIEAWTEDRRLFWANGKPIPGVGVRHDFGYIPGKLVVGTPGKLYGLNPVQSIGLGELINEHLILTAEERTDRMNQILHIKGGIDIPDEIPARGAILETEDTGNIEFVGQIQGDLNSFNAEMDQAEMMYRKQENWPLSRSSSPESAIWTQVGIKAAQAPVADDISAAQASIGQGLKFADECCVKIEKKMFGSKKQVANGTMYNGPFKPKEPFSFQYVPKDDLIEEFKHRMEFSPFGDPAVLNMIWLQRLGQEVVSLQSTREVLPGIDPAEEKRRVDQEREEKMGMAMAMQGMAPGGGQGGGQPGMGPQVGAEQMEDEFFAGTKGATR